MSNKTRTTTSTDKGSQKNKRIKKPKHTHEKNINRKKRPLMSVVHQFDEGDTIESS